MVTIFERAVILNIKFWYVKTRKCNPYKIPSPHLFESHVMFLLFSTFWKNQSECESVMELEKECIWGRCPVGRGQQMDLKCVDYGTQWWSRWNASPSTMTEMIYGMTWLLLPSSNIEWQSWVSMTTKAHPLTRLNILPWLPFTLNLDFLFQMPTDWLIWWS